MLPTNMPEFGDRYRYRNITESGHRTKKRRKDTMGVRGLALQTYYLAIESLVWNVTQARHAGMHGGWALN